MIKNFQTNQGIQLGSGDPLTPHKSRLQLTGQWGTLTMRFWAHLNARCCLTVSDNEVWGHTIGVAAAMYIGMYGQFIARGSVMVRLVSECCIIENCYDLHDYIVFR